MPLLPRFLAFELRFAKIHLKTKAKAKANSNSNSNSKSKTKQKKRQGPTARAGCSVLGAKVPVAG
jgi:hypothetical protein